MDRTFEPLPCASEGSIIDRFEESARRYAARTAVTDAVRCLTYAELARRVALAAAATAQTLGDRPGPIAILLPRGVDFPVAMLGALAAGRGYVALDPTDPIARNRLIAVHSSAAAVISAGDLTDAMRFFPDLPVIDIDGISNCAMSKPVLRPLPDDLAFIIYTSGSTGVPKGVYQNHRNFLHIMMQMTQSLFVKEEDRLITLRSPSSISATKEILLALLNGASVHFASPLELQPTSLVSEIERRSITVLRMTPTLLRSIEEVPNASQRLTAIRIVQLSAERVEWSDFDVFRRIFPPSSQLSVILNSTETEMACWLVDDAARATSDRLPVGYAIPGFCLTIMDEDGRPAKEGEAGEVVIKSRYVALGYWRDPEATALRFNAEPDNPDMRTYRTADVARRRPDGLVEFIGRKDDQIKLHGYRIEIGEIEFALKDCSGVEDATVVVRRDRAGLPQSLTAYVVLKRGVHDLGPRKLAALLRTRLPRHMVPRTIAVVDDLPRLPNFKIDREELRQREQRNDKRKLIEPIPIEPGRTRTEELLLKMWSEVLDRHDIGDDDDFFLCGGNSISAFELMLRIEKEFQCQAPLTVLVEAPTVSQLAYRLDTLTLAAINKNIPIHTAGRQRPLFVVYTAGGHALALLPVLRSLGPDQPCYWLQPPDMDWTGTRCATLGRIAAYYVQQVKALQPHGPYRLLGNSFAGQVVFEMALQLQEMSESVELLAILDTEPPTCLLRERLDICESRTLLRMLKSRPAPDTRFEAATRGTLENHVRMARDCILDSRTERNIFRGELTYLHCTGNPIVAGRDRRRLWQSFSPKFRLLLVPGSHGTPDREPQYPALRKLLTALLNDEPVTGSDPASVYDRHYRLDNPHRPRNIRSSMGHMYRIDQERLQGCIDEIRIDGEAIQFKGWAIDHQQPAQTIVVFLDDEFLGYGSSGQLRPDIAKRLRADTVLFSGFDFIFEGAVSANVLKQPRVFALSNDGWAAELRLPGEPVAIGSVKKLSDTEPSGLILSGNWSSRERWGVWSNGHRAEVIFNAISLPDWFNVAVRANLFPPAPYPIQRVRICDEAGNLLTIIANEKPNSEFIVPMQKTPSHPGPWKSLVFDIAVPTSPQDLGLSGDRRKLGIGLVSLTFLK